jgi:type II secretory pathway component PulL
VTGPERLRTRRRKRRPWRPVALLVALVVVGAVGVALGEALHDNPQPGGTQSYVRTLRPLSLAPAAQTTVTVTTSSK